MNELQILISHLEKRIKKLNRLSKGEMPLAEKLDKINQTSQAKVLLREIRANYYVLEDPVSKVIKKHQKIKLENAAQKVMDNFGGALEKLSDEK